MLVRCVRAPITHLYFLHVILDNVLMVLQRRLQLFVALEQRFAELGRELQICFSGLAINGGEGGKMENRFD